MAKRYRLNPDTLLYEVSTIPRRQRLLRVLGLFVLSILVSFLYLFLWAGVLGKDLPRTAHLKKKNAEWTSKVEVMNARLDQYEADLAALEMRNENVYRSIFGMNPIPQEVLEGSSDESSRFDFLEQMGPGSALRATYIRLDRLMHQTYVESKSFDEVSNLSKRAGDMASCIPAISPISTDKSRYHLSSPFGGRADPVHGRYRFHSGVDFATKPGNPVYATGDGVVRSVEFQFSGYGNQVVIDHGFGYQTRYAHLSVINVGEGMKVKRGQRIAATGNSGRSTGPHLHYEVLYRGSNVNPYHFYDLDMSPAEYAAMVESNVSQTDINSIPPFIVKKKK